MSVRVPKTRFTLVVKGHFGFASGELEQGFFSLASLEQWLDNARAEGFINDQHRIAIYDDSGVRL